MARVALMVGLAGPNVGVESVGAAAPREQVIEGLFDVGGYRLYLRCTGAGSPTVVMDASPTWSDVEPLLARVTGVCVYDRAALGRSDPGPVPRTSQTMVDELTTLLGGAGVPGPYVLVGHSIAGFNVQLFAREDGGDTVVGVVLIDATPPDFLAVLDSVGVPIPPPEDAEENPEGIDLRPSAAQVLTAGPFAPVPLIVLTHGIPILGPLEEAWQELQVAQSQLSPKGRLIVARGAAHFIQNDQPRLVLRSSWRSSPWPGTTSIAAAPSVPPAEGIQLRRAGLSARRSPLESLGRTGQTSQADGRREPFDGRGATGSASVTAMSTRLSAPTAHHVSSAGDVHSDLDADHTPNR